jgi:hypothetical protein
MRLYAYETQEPCGGRGIGGETRQLPYGTGSRIWQAAHCPTSPGLANFWRFGRVLRAWSPSAASAAAAALPPQLR